jgi:hypothetical protein
MRNAVRACTLWLACCLFSPAAWPAGVPRNECFPVEKLTPGLREKFEAQLLAALDSEYLYTLVTGLKPMTDDGMHAPFGLMYRYPDIAALRELQALRAIWTCSDEIYADVVVSWSDSPRPQDDGKRTARLLLVNRPAFRDLIERKQTLFGPYGFTSDSNPSVVYYAAWNSKEEANRMLGYLYGFPDHAVEWYAFAVAEHNLNPTVSFAEWVKQETRRIWIPLFTDPPPSTYGFHYSVAKAHQPNKDDSELLARADRILVEYKARRLKYIGVGRPGVVAMMREWYDDGTGHCAPSNIKLAPPSPPHGQAIEAK